MVWPTQVRMTHQIYAFYLVGIQPENIDDVLKFVERHATKNKRMLKSAEGDIIMSAQIEQGYGSIKEITCYVDRCVAFCIK